MVEQCFAEIFADLGNGVDRLAVDLAAAIDLAKQYRQCLRDLADAILVRNGEGDWTTYQVDPELFGQHFNSRQEFFDAVTGGSRCQ